MPKITFGDNPLDHSSKLRGDIKWQKNALQSDKSKFMIFYEDRPLIKTDPANRDNPKIYWLTYLDIKYLKFLLNNSCRSWTYIDVLDCLSRTIYY